MNQSVHAMMPDDPTAMELRAYERETDPQLTAAAEKVTMKYITTCKSAEMKHAQRKLSEEKMLATHTKARAKARADLAKLKAKDAKLKAMTAKK